MPRRLTNSQALRQRSKRRRCRRPESVKFNAMKSPAYDCLNQEEIEIAKQPITKEEELSLKFNDSIPRGKDAGIRHNVAHKFLSRCDRLIFARYNIWHLAKATSMDTTNLWSVYRFIHLFRLITKLKPKIVMEFGLGVSSVIIAETLKLNHQRYGIKGKLISHEQSQKYYDKFNPKFPSSLREYAELNLTPVRLEWFGPYRGIYYDIDDYPKVVDLIYVDGATRTRGCSQCDFAYRRLNADIIRMKNCGTKFKTAITDHRYANHPFYVNELSSEFKVSLSKIWRSIIITKK